MSIPTDRESLKNWCLKALGEPLMHVNISAEQLEDRIDEALHYFYQFHYDGTEKVYISHLLTGTTLTFASAISGNFSRPEQVEGGTSGALGTVIDQADDNLSIRVKTISGTWQNGESILGKTSGATGNLAAVNAITLGDIDNKYITLPDSVVSVVRVLPAAGMGNFSMFDIRYQMALTSIQDMTMFDMTTYHMIRNHYELINAEFVGIKGVRFNCKTNKLYVEMDWSLDTLIDSYVIIECNAFVDADTYDKVYGDLWLREYATALIDRQWGQNLSKFDGISLPGGVKLDGKGKVNDANAKIRELIKDLDTRYTEPLPFYVA